MWTEIRREKDSTIFIGRIISMLLGTALLCAQPSKDTSPLAHLQSLVPKAERTQVMVLGTFHFREIQDRFKPSMVEQLLRKLEGFKPDVIAVEMLPGSRINELELRPKATPIHEELLSNYASVQLELGHQAQSLLKLDMIEASKALATQVVPPIDSAALVRQTLLDLAAYELPSALLSWSRIPGGDHGARSQLPATLADKLDAQLSRVNEMQAIAIPLARRLGLPVINCVDKFEDPEAMGPVIQALITSLKDSPLIAVAGKSQVYIEATEHRDAAVKEGDLLQIFRYLNSPSYSAGDVDAQWGLFLRTHLKDGSDRGRLALWENRNLMIAGRIRAITARHPGKRILIIYGAAHKPFLDAYLGMCSDLQIIQPQTFL
jgi:Family of unknown function (DUF5694)